MPATLTLYDETTLGEKRAALTLSFDTTRISVRDLIRDRVYNEVWDYNQNKTGIFRGLVQPTDSERQLNGFKLKQPRQINWEEQYQKALAAFENNSFVILVGDRQVDDLDTEIEISDQTQVSFLKLIPLVGG
uniref:Uncharacterized protein n=1 Tax=Cyanothece sp. (strain PCC 7425 / ATCC 29141) TaxID=395961 RepID=B8HT70_CYAP4